MVRAASCATLTQGRSAIAAITVAASVLVVAEPAHSQNATANLLHTIDTSRFDPPSPDPSGLTFLPDSASLLISDGEVNETPLFTGDNLYVMNLTGDLLETRTTLPFSDEPAGVEIVYTQGELTMYVADDTGGSRIYVVKAGKDGILSTADDVVTSFPTSTFGSRDPEGLAFARNSVSGGTLFVADGVSSTLYLIQPGPNRKFDGADDRVQSFDTESLGIRDPEGVAYNTDNGHLYIVGRRSSTVAEVTTRGILVQSIDISEANARKPSGIAYGPSSANPDTPSLYISDRGADNNPQPDENDGRIYEMTVPAPLMR